MIRTQTRLASPLMSMLGAPTTTRTCPA
ncbi:hypothetical protein CABS01_16801 [Colletotrichum abscissum]|nr:hypothetical protein CABS01_16801 [Colletotrichum abscissum]